MKPSSRIGELQTLPKLASLFDSTIERLRKLFDTLGVGHRRHPGGEEVVSMSELQVRVDRQDEAVRDAFPEAGRELAPELRPLEHQVRQTLQQVQIDTLLTPSEVAALFGVKPKTVTRWARMGRLSTIRTLGGHRRFRADEIRKFLDATAEG